MWKPSNLPDLTGKVYIVTGGNAGLGYQTVYSLCSHHAKVYICARSAAKATEAIASIKKTIPAADLHVLVMDHMDLQSVVAAANTFKSQETRLNGLINNAGIMATPFQKSDKDGYEAQWQTNYLAHWLLTWHLLPISQMTAKAEGEGSARIVNVSSGGHERFAPEVGIDFDDINQEKGGPWSRYGMSKLGNVLHALELHTRYGPGAEAGSVVWASSLHPGNAWTQLNQNALGIGRGAISMLFVAVVRPLFSLLKIYISEAEASYTSLYVAAAQEYKSSQSGQYFKPIARQSHPSKQGRDEKMAKRLWEWTETEMKAKGLLS